MGITLKHIKPSPSQTHFPWCAGRRQSASPSNRLSSSFKSNSSLRWLMNQEFWYAACLHWYCTAQPSLRCSIVFKFSLVNGIDSSLSVSPSTRHTFFELPGNRKFPRNASTPSFPNSEDNSPCFIICMEDRGIHCFRKNVKEIMLKTPWNKYNMRHARHKS